MLFFMKKIQKIALVGDVLFQGSIGRTDLPGGNHQDLIDSIKNKLWPLGSDVKFIPGHGPNSSFGAERESNAFVSDSVLS
jgi:glyoxylase-like metal-dependent hydrolase (beta-lactamase superfamily II)